MLTPSFLLQYNTRQKDLCKSNSLTVKPALKKMDKLFHMSASTKLTAATSWVRKASCTGALAKHGITGPAPTAGAFLSAAGSECAGSAGSRTR